MNTSKIKSYRLIFGVMALLLTATGAHAFNQFWDSSTDAGYQHGNGVWSTTDAQWTLTGTSPVAAWTNFNRAVFAAEGGSSAITLNSAILTTGIVFHGSAQILTISNGGAVSNSSLVVSMIGGTNRIELVGGASTASWTNNTTLNIGLTNGFNEFIVNGAGTAGSAFATNTGAITVGNGINSAYNRLVVTNGGFLNSLNTVIVGNNTSTYNSAEVVGGGARWNLGGQMLMIGRSAGATGNTLRIDGLGTAGAGKVTNVASLKVGTDAGAEYNTIIVTNGGQLFSGVTYGMIGSTSSYNSVMIAGGTGTLWNGGGQALYIGYNTATGNVLHIDGRGVAGGAMVTNFTTIVVGTIAGSGFNRMVITNGGRAFSTAISYLGNNSFSNRVDVTGGDALWNLNASILSIGRLVGGDNNRFTIDGQGTAGRAKVTNVTTIYVGNMIGGVSNELAIVNGGQLFATAATVGFTSSYNRLTVRGSDAFLKLGGALYVGEAGATGNVLTIDGLGVAGGAVVATATTFRVGQLAGANFNRAEIVNGGRLCSSNASYVGVLSFSNTLALAGNGALWDAGGQPLILGYWIGGNGNRMTIDGMGGIGGALVTNVAAFTIGDRANNSGNELVITNGGQFFSAGAALIGFTSTYNRVSIAGGGSAWYLNNQSLTIGQGVGAANNTIVVDGFGSAGGALLTNAGAITVGLTGGSEFNSLVLTNGGQLFSRGASTIGSSASNNAVLVTGMDSKWDNAGSNLTLGISSFVSNSLMIDRTGTVQNVGTLTIRPTNDILVLGGTLTASNITYMSGSRFTVGDGAQVATLGLLGGSLISSNGLLIVSNGILAGRGIAHGGSEGVVLTNGAAIAPGLSGAGALTIGGSNLTWHGGATYRCDIINMAGGPGIGWDVVNVSSQLALLPNDTKCLISIESQGQPAAGFQEGDDYNILIMTLPYPSDFDIAKVELLTNAFMPPANGTWGITNYETNVYLTYRATVSSPSVFTWDAPSNGNWSAGMNWTTRTAPPVNSLSMVLEFGGGAADPRYYATNNAGTFALNRLILTNANGAITNILAGNMLEFWNAGARIEQGGSGGFVVSNAINLQTDLSAGGEGAGLVTLAGAIRGNGAVTKQGASTMILSVSNSFTGAVTVNGAGGALRIDNTNALGTNSFVVNNGTLLIRTNFSLGLGAGRTARVSGSGAIWSNTHTLTIGSNGTVTVADGGRLACGAMTANGWAAGNTLAITNGGQVFSQGATAIGNVSSNNTAQVIGTDSLWNLAGSNLTLGATGFTNNVLTIDQGAAITNVGTLTINPSNDLSFLGGVLSVSNVTSTKGTLLSLGDGSQSATLNLWGGTVSNNAGILVQSNAMVIGNGLLTGGSGGVVFTNGSVLTPGMPGNATTTISTSTLGGNATWYGGMTLNLNITNITGSGGVNWDTVRILGSLNLIPNGGKLKIKLDSLGETGGGFNANTARAVSLVSFASASATTNDIEVDATDFLIGSNWFMEVTATDIRYVYRRENSAIYIATSGDNSAGTNWATAYTTLSNAMAYVQNYDTVYMAGQMFSITAGVAMAGRAGVAILGGYEATSDAVLPGPNNPVQWPTILKRTGGTGRIMTMTGVTNGVLRNLGITGGNGTSDGGGLYISVSRLSLEGCKIYGNSINAGSLNGGGLYCNQSTLTISNCQIVGNQNNGAQYASSYGGGLYAANSAVTILNTIVATNKTWAFRWLPDLRGGGIFIAGANSTLLARNCLITRNDSTCDDGSGTIRSDGIEIGGGTGVLDNCTIANNYGEGLRQAGGTVMITNSILWNNGVDLTGTVSVAYCDIQTANSFWTNLVNGCLLAADPQFADTTYYHLKSRAGFYTNGFFSGGGWSTNSTVTNNPAIDSGNPHSTWSLEPQPSGHRVNLGAYGNTEVASKTFLEEPAVFTSLTVYAYPPANVGPSSGTLAGEVLHDGGQGDPDAYICWDNRGDRTLSTGDWQNVTFMGQQPMWQQFATNLTGLAGTTYYRCFVTNDAGSDWSGLQSFTVAALPEVTNNGAFPVYRRTATLRAEITDVGGDDPYVWFYYWVDGASTTNIVAVPGQPTGPFSATVSGLMAGSNYQYQALASNSAGGSWSSVSNFTTVASEIAWYVATNGTGLLGTNWSGAFPTAQEAVNISENGDTIYLAGHSFWISNTVNWFARTNMTIQGGFQATSDAVLPGPNDPVSWPTVIRRIGSGTIRIMTVSSISNGIVEGVTFMGGNATADGGGLYISGSSLTLDTCTIASNTATVYGYGGGIYSSASALTLTNCIVKNNTGACGNYQSVYGGGIAVVSGQLNLKQSVITRNTVGGTAASYSAPGGGLYMASGTTGMVNNCLFTYNDATIADVGQYVGDGICVGGKAFFANCTIAGNLGQGIYNAGTVGLTNSILWNNGDDLTGAVFVAYSIIQTADPTWTNLVNGCLLAADPQFADPTNCHPKSRAGFYTNGYFSGGGWSTNSTVTNNPAIDAGDTNSPWANELQPSGHRINLGAYGNTPVASKTYLEGDGVFTNLTVHSYPPYNVGVDFGTLSGEVLNDGSDGANPPDAYICWDNRGDRTLTTGDWQNVAFMGQQPMWQLFATNLTGLSGTTYYRCYVTNNAGSDWSDLQSFGVAAFPEVTNNGAFPVYRRSATLTGTITETGGDTPYVWFYYWVADSATTNFVAVPGQQSGVFSNNLSGLLAGSNYQFQILASNSAGANWSSVSNFTTVASPAAWYVATNGTGLLGTNWSGAFPTIQPTLVLSENGDTIYLAGHSFAISNGLSWSARTNMTIRGGYAATNNAVLPGSNNPALWPTVIRRTGSGTIRIMAVVSVTNSMLEYVNLTGGAVESHGGGLYVSGSGLTLSGCNVYGNAVNVGNAYGGGIYCNQSTVTITNCAIVGNQNNGGQYSFSYGGGLYVGNSAVTLLNTVIASNTVYAFRWDPVLAGGGIAVGGANSTLLARNCLVFRNRCYCDDGTGIVRNNGIDVDGGTATVVNCTIANNYGEGIRRVSGTVAVTNSILWGNTDDLIGTISVAYSDIQTADSFWTNGFNGCISTDPLFVNATYYHLQSQAGNYTNGYFRGGGWELGSSNSPCIDAGDPTYYYNDELSPRGRAINLGAYGNTEVASKTYIPPGTMLIFH